MVTVAVLGPVQVYRDGQFIPVRAGKTAQVLVRLALDAGQLVAADRLIEDLWADEALATARNTLQTKVSRLRRELGDASLVTGSSAGYTLNVLPAAVDALEALRLAAVGSACRSAGDSAGSFEAASAGLALFHGDSLSGAGDGDWLVPHRVRLDEARLRLREDEIAARLELDGPDGVVGELEELVERHGVREGLRALLMTALYRAGRQADALTTYERARAQLADELGVDPGPELQQLFSQILGQHGSLARIARQADAADAPSGNLPRMLAELIGRHSDTARVCELLAEARFVQVTGPGGVGKTALALAVAQQIRVRDGVWLARLDTAVTADDVVDALVAALKLPGGEETLFDRLADAEAMVVLDNCEHVLGAVTSLALRLLDAAPALRILCTSQVPLEIDGGAAFELAPLALSEAAELFRRRAAVQRGTQPPFDQEELLRLCRSLDGLPLAIELAAARTKTLRVEEITRRLDDRFAVLSDPTSLRPERRRSLRATIQWSYDLLFPDDQRGLWALATFSGGASLPALESVLGALDVPAATALDVIGRLASRSLLIVDEEHPASDSPDPQMASRYRLLDSIRAFALEAMRQAGLSERAHGAHADWITEAAATSTGGVRSSNQAHYLSFARQERANIDAALAWCGTRDRLRALHIARGFGWAWIVLGDSRGAHRLATALEGAGTGAPPEERADALLLAAWILASIGDLQLATEHITLATTLANAQGGVALRARCAYYLAYVVSHGGDFLGALELVDRSHELYETLDRPWDQAAAGLFAARAATSAGDEARSVAALDRVQGWLLRVEDPWLHVRCEAARGELARLQHRFDDAVTHLGRAARISGQRGFQQTEAYQVASLGRAQCQTGDYVAGAATLQRAAEKAEAAGDARLVALISVHLARVLRALGRTAAARSTIESAVAWHRSTGGGEQAVLGECLLAALDAAEHKVDARQRLHDIAATARHHDDAPAEVLALDALARLARQKGDQAAAAELSQRADDRMPAASHFITDRDRTDLQAAQHIG